MSKKQNKKSNKKVPVSKRLAVTMLAASMISPSVSTIAAAKTATNNINGHTVYHVQTDENGDTELVPMTDEEAAQIVAASDEAAPVAEEAPVEETVTEEVVQTPAEETVAEQVPVEETVIETAPVEAAVVETESSESSEGEGESETEGTGGVTGQNAEEAGEGTPENKIVVTDGEGQTVGEFENLAEAVVATNGLAKATIDCPKDADLGTVGAMAVKCQNLTINGNGASITGGDSVLNMSATASGATVEVNQLNGIGLVASSRSGRTSHAVKFNQCKDMSRVWVTTGALSLDKMDLTLNECTFDGSGRLNNSVAVWVNAAGSLKVIGGSFSNVKLPINVANKSAAANLSVTVTGTRFTNCSKPSTLTNDTDYGDYAAPIRLVAYAANSVTATVDGAIFEGEVGPSGDIVVGDGRTNSESELAMGKVTLTAANLQRVGGAVIQAHSYGYKELLKLKDPDMMQEFILSSTDTLVLTKMASDVSSNMDRDLESAVAVYNERGFDTLADALDAVKADVAEGKIGEDGATIVCKAGTDLGAMDTVDVTCDLTIEGNGGTLTSGTRMLSVKNAPAGVTVNVDGVNGIGLYGYGENASGSSTVNFTNCQDMTKIDFDCATLSAYRLNLSLENCSFDGTSNAANMAVQIAVAGTMNFDTVNFTNVMFPMHIANKSSAMTMNVNISHCEFTDCSAPNQNWYDDYKSWSAPIRFIAGSLTTIDATIDDVTFNGAVGPNGDILVGEGRTTGTTNAKGTVKVTGTNLKRDGGAVVQAQQHSYKNQVNEVQDTTKMRQYIVQASDTIELTKKGETITCNMDEDLSRYNVVYDGRGFNTLKDALTAIETDKPGSATVICKEGADLGSLDKANVVCDLTIEGNGARVTGGARDLIVDEAVPLDRDITITVNDLNNFGLTGGRKTNYNITANFTNCDDIRTVYISHHNDRPAGEPLVNLSFVNCSFNGNNVSDMHPSVIFTHFAGEITVDGCSFTKVPQAVSVNNKTAGEAHLTVTNSTFDNCGSTAAGEFYQSYNATIRLVAQKNGTVTADISDCTFDGARNDDRDILIGEGRTRGDFDKEGGRGTVVATLWGLNGGDTPVRVAVQNHGYYSDNYGAIADASKAEYVALLPEDRATITKADTEITTKLVLGNPAAVVGDMMFRTTQEAFDYVAEHGGKLELKTNATLDSMVTIDKDVTIDLGGNTLTTNVPSDPSFYVTSAGSLTFSGDGQFALNSKGFARVEAGAKINVSGGSFSGDTQGEAVFHVVLPEAAARSVAADGALDFQDVNSKVSAPFLVVDQNVQAPVTVAGGTFESAESVFVLNGDGDVKLNDVDAISTSGYAIETAGSDVTVTGGSYEGAAGAVKAEDGEFSIDGGEFKGDLVVDENATMSIRKGRFSMSLAELRERGFLAANTAVMINTDNGTTVGEAKDLIQNAGGEFDGVLYEDYKQAEKDAEAAGEKASAVVQFVSDGANVASVKVLAGETIAQPEDPTLDGYTFKGWMDSNGKQWDFTTPVTGSMTLTAAWEKNAVPDESETPETPSTPGNDGSGSTGSGSGSTSTGSGSTGSSSTSSSTSRPSGPSYVVSSASPAAVAAAERATGVSATPVDATEQGEEAEGETHEEAINADEAENVEKTAETAVDQVAATSANGQQAANQLPLIGGIAAALTAFAASIGALLHFNKKRS